MAHNFGSGGASILSTAMESDVILYTLVLSLLAVASGALIAIVASRRAPEGFEDVNGCHLSPPLPSAAQAEKAPSHR